MNKAVLPGVILAAAFVLFGGAVMLVPSLQSDQTAVTADVRYGVERARRLIDQVGENEERLEVVLEGLRLADVAELDDDTVAELTEADRELLDEAGERLGDILNSTRAERRALHERMQNAGGEVIPSPRPTFGANASQMAAAIREGLRARDRILAENDSLLAEALTVVREALAVQQGEASGRSDPAPLRLEGAILYSQATGAQRKARWLRERARRPRTELAVLSGELDRLGRGGAVVEASEIDARIDAAKTQRAERQAARDALREAVASLARTIADLEARLARHQSEADEARAALDALAQKGIDFSDPQGFRKFSVMYAGQSKLYREALRQAQILEFGTLANASLDDSGDFLEGAYVPDGGSGDVSPQRGLYHYRAELAEREQQAAAAQEALAAVESQVAAMEQDRAMLARSAEDAAAQATGARETASIAFEDLTALLDEAAELEEVAIGKLDSAAGAFRAAARAAQTRSREAGDAISGLNRDAAQRSAKSVVAEDRWSPASSQARVADTRLRAAMIHYDRYRDSSTVASLLAELAQRGLDLADIEAHEDEAESARQSGLEAAKEAADTLLTAGRSLNNHYSIAAEIASAYYLQSLLGEPDVLQYAIRNYEAAVEGREDSPFAQQYVERLKQLRRQRNK